MSSSPLDLNVNLDKEKIVEVRQAWIDAVKHSDANRLAELVTSDVVGVHASGRSTSGKEALRDFFLSAFDQFNIEGKVSSSEIIVHGIWAIEIDEVQTRRTRVDGNIPIFSQFRAVFVFGRQLDNSWKIARIIELED